MKLATVAVVGMLALAGCATPYQEMGALGGVQAVPMMQDVWRVTAHGNGFTDASTVQDYVLLKAAETTLGSGGRYFIVTSSQDTSQSSIGQTAGLYTYYGYGVGSYTPGTTYQIVKPGIDTYIRVVRESPPPAGAIDAQQIVQFIGSRVKRPTSSVPPDGTPPYKPYVPPAKPAT